MTKIPPPAEELRILDHELWQLDARRGQLLARRAWLVGVLQSASAQALAPDAAPTPTAAPTAAPRPGQPTGTAPRRETTAPSVQNVLLVLGGVLLTIAAIAFTLVSWGDLGIAGRAMVLGAVTLAALGVPVPLLRRGLRSTAESVAGLGLALTVLDVYALHQVAFPDADATGYAAAASALLAALWAAYGLALGALRLPLPAAMAAAQLPLFLWAVAAGAGDHALTAVLLVTAAFDAVMALRMSVKSVRLVAAVGAYGWGAWGVLAAGWLSWEATGPSAAARAAALLFLAAAIALGAAWHVANVKTATGIALTGGLVVVAAIGGIPRPVLPETWTVPGYLACGIAVAVPAILGIARLPEPVRRGLVGASAGVQALAVAWALSPVGVALLGPVGRLGRVWSGAPADARDAVTLADPWPADADTAPLVLAVVAMVLAWAFRSGPRRPLALSGALTLAWATALVLPATLELPYSAALLAQGVTTAATLAAAAYGRRGGTPEPASPASPLPLTALALALVTSVHLVLLSLATETATLAVLTGLTALFAAVALTHRLAPLCGPVCAAASTAYAAALACATGASLGWQPHHIALLVLVVPATAALLAARLKEAAPTASVEVTGAVAGLLAMALAITDLPTLALVLALCGVIAAGTAVRPDRQRAGYAAAALFLLATWVRLAAWEVDVPEAYTLPVTVPALVVGVVRRSRDARVSSWTAYGAGLSVTLVPSLVAAWGDPDWPRPLLLGAAALLVTLVGARHRLRAPLLLGSTVLALDALHELAPYIVQVAGALPRWLPPALAGLALLALGATYEQRIRDARRVREVLGRMR
ncbi:hypothetical protein FE633_27165 [Streptomyces montanus]|uniref:Uncharacterized protein n=1 Tax=Streptomyces montanus TaxID=2580423 RepID=A0A5R9FP13_9ACTN|nr:hypothetical protein [Streptomyces montanus]TLS43228.1 hypothetical protein FE633_27165 [Streptomyces montanus]